MSAIASEAVTDVLVGAGAAVERLRGKFVVVKIGGSALGAVDTAIEDIVRLRGLGIDVVVVHGGGAVISSWLKRIGKEPRFVNGLRVTDEETMELVVMTLAGKVNKDLVADLQRHGGRAIGICGIDGGTLVGVRKDEQLGLVGRVTRVDTTAIRALCAAGIVPVIAPIALGEGRDILNLNADTAAGEIAVALEADRVVYLTDVAGVLDAEKRLIRTLTAAEARGLIASGVISGGMIPKVEACLQGLSATTSSCIIDGRVAHALLRELFSEGGFGTTFRSG